MPFLRNEDHFRVRGNDPESNRDSLPTVSIVIPCRNEEAFIGDCLASIIENSYPKDRLEVLVVDGMSEDRTGRIVEGYAQRYAFIRFLENPEKITPTALNTHRR